MEGSYYECTWSVKREERRGTFLSIFIRRQDRRCFEKRVSNCMHSAEHLFLGIFLETGGSFTRKRDMGGEKERFLGYSQLLDTRKSYEGVFWVGARDKGWMDAAFTIRGVCSMCIGPLGVFLYLCVVGDLD